MNSEQIQRRAFPIIILYMIYKTLSSYAIQIFTFIICISARLEFIYLGNILYILWFAGAAMLYC